MTTTRRLAAILAADVVGYSRLMSADESGTLAWFKLLRGDHFEPAVQRHEGRVVGEAGDSLLVEFGTATEAVACAVEIQSKLAELNAELPEDRRMRFRMGVNLGEVIIDGATIHGDGVNIAARLEKLADPGGLVISRAVHDQVKGKVPARFDDLGDQSLHNIGEPVRAYRAAPDRPSIPDTKPSRANRATIAVLPFSNMSGDPEQEYFSDGITEDLITELSRFREFRVVARNSSFTFKGRPIDVKEVHQKVGADYVVEGSVRKAGSRIRVTAQLVETETGSHVWAERYDRDLADVFAVQDEVTRAVVSALAGHVGRVTRERALHKIKDLSAYELVLRARLPYDFSSKAMTEEARAIYLKALSLDDGLTEAWIQLAATYLFDAEFGWTADPETSIDQGLTAAKRAVESDPTDARAMHTLSYAYSHLGQHDLAMRYSTRSYELNPNDVVVIGARALMLAYQGRAEEGIALIGEARSRNPLVPQFLMWNLGGVVRLK